MSRATVSRRSFKRSNSLKVATTALALAALSTGALLAALPASASPHPLNLEVLALTEDFEGVLSARGWTFGDNNPVNGSDYWAPSTYRASEGNTSVFAAGVGDQLGYDAVDIWQSDFENGTTGWTFTDLNSSDTAGLDFWGPTSFRTHSGNTSIWCAQNGANYNGGGSANSALHQYDLYMNSTATVNTALSAYSNIRIDYWFWTNAEPSWDGLYVAWFDTAWHFENAKNNNQSALGWQKASYPIPSSANRVGFMFTSDSSIVFEGSYIDDVRLYGYRSDANAAIHAYDDNMDAQITHDVDVSIFDGARIEYRYWLDAQSNDTLQLMVSNGFGGTYMDAHTGVSGGWAASSVTIPIDTKTIGFRFVSDGNGRAGGAYIDEVNVWGSVLPVSCTAIAYETGGMEVVSPFHLAGTATGGLRPYTWSWSFGDGTVSTGTRPSNQNPTHEFPEVGIYAPILTVSDSLGQSCNTATAPITVTHDITNVFITPATARITEGTSLTVYGFDGQGHPYDLDWSLMFPECGQLSTSHGATVVVTSATDAGGTTCTLTGAVGSAKSSMRITVLQDTSTIHLTPPTATVIEGQGLRLSATDRYGGELPFIWTTSCGRVGGAAASFTLFEAVIEGGVVCTVTASFGSDHATSIITVVHDTGLIDVTPKTATLTEGGGQSFSAVDGYGHPFEAEWSVDPAACGSFSILTGATTTFTSAIDAGGLDCTVIVAYGEDQREVAVTVQHDLRDSSVTPTSVSVQGGATVEFSYGDANGHPFGAVWSVSPGGCGVFEFANSSVLVTPNRLTVSGDYAGYTCTVSATGIGFTRFASVSVEYGAPASLVVTPSSEVIEADGQVLVSVAVKDPAGHTIPSISVAWSTTTCSVSAASGPTTTLLAPRSAAGGRCTVTATLAALTGSADVRVNHVGPFTVKVTPEAPTLGGGQSQTFTAVVTDGEGNPVPDAAVVWSSSCGALSNSTGAAVVFVAPSDVATNHCAVTASASAGGVAYQSVANVKGGSSPLLLILGIVIAGAAVGLVAFRMRGRSPPASLEGAEVAPHEGTASEVPPTAPETAAAEGPAAAAMACPKCGSGVEAGWTTCPECGTDLAAPASS